MAILNVTPDSFSDGGAFLDTDRAVDRGLEAWRQGADLVDVGGESTRPGAAAVTASEELRRVLPVVERLHAQGVAVSIDTSKAEVAAAALEAGAESVNDVTALGDPEMAAVVAEAGAGLLLMHMQGTPRTMQDDPHYEDVVTEVRDFLTERAACAQRAGVEPGHICIDPGIGFGKDLGHNLDLLAHLGDLVETGLPVLVGTSRKSFLGRMLGIEDPRARDVATAATVALAISAGAAAVRVHDVATALQIARVTDAIVRSI